MKHFLYTFLLFSIIHTRGPLHFDNPIPTVYTQWSWIYDEQPIYFPRLSNKQYRFSNTTITEFPLFKTFAHADIKQHYLPDDTIIYRNGSGSITGKKLKEILQHFFEEILQMKKTYQDFVPLKKDFNIKKQAGLLIVKAKKYPFVVKLFMETPRSFLRPHNKGFDPVMQFGVGGGATRHLLGFTRIKNRHTILSKIQQSPRWSEYVDVPRKWYWLPDYPWITLTAHNLGPNPSEQKITLPGAYMIIADAIEPEKLFTLRSKEDRQNIIDLANYLECRVDPNIPNFMIEKNTGKLVIIDTEHFPTLVGLQKPFFMTSYAQYYSDLTKKYLKEHVFSSKRDRKERQESGYVPFCLP